MKYANDVFKKSRAHLKYIASDSCVNGREVSGSVSLIVSPDNPSCKSSKNE